MQQTDTAWEDGGVANDVSGVENTNAQELLGDLSDSAVHNLGLVGTAHLIDQQADAPIAAVAREDFNDGIGVGDRRGLGRRYDQDVVGDTGEAQHVGADARAGIDENDVGDAFEIAHGVDKGRPVVVR